VALRIAVGASAYSEDGVDFVREAERLGAHSAWSAEAWGYDGLTPLAYLAAKTSKIMLGSGIVQVGARTPGNLAMASLSLQALSGGRFLLGLGTSGPQVMEGLHGVRFEKVLQRTRETIEIVKRLASGERSGYDGELYTLPLPDGPGRSIRLSAEPRPVPIYIASLGPRNLHLTGELADGWLGTSFMPDTADIFFDHIRAGAEAADRTLDGFDFNVSAGVTFTDDVEEAAKRHARGYAFTFGAMGSAKQNFYKDAFERQGYIEDARAVQKLWLEGKREEAAERVPVEIALKTNLIGTPDMIRDRLRVYRDAGVTTIRAGLAGKTLDDRLQALARLTELAAEI
jgi:F420-dependent oxidoreductase-like protein